MCKVHSVAETTPNSKHFEPMCNVLKVARDDFRGKLWGSHQADQIQKAQTNFEAGMVPGIKFENWINILKTMTICNVFQLPLGCSIRGSVGWLVGRSVQIQLF